MFSPQRQIRPAPTGAPNQTIQILQGQPNPTPSKLHFIHKWCSNLILVLINNGQIQLQQQIQQPQQRLVFLQPVQQPNGQLTYIQSQQHQQQIQPKPQQVSFLCFPEFNNFIVTETSSCPSSTTIIIHRQSNWTFSNVQNWIKWFATSKKSNLFAFS